MLLFTKNSFVSVVQHRDAPHLLLVRARRKADLIRLFPAMKGAVTTNAQADYKYRLMVSKDDLKEVMAKYISASLAYDNFKAAQERDSLDWTNFLRRVWEAGYLMQK